MQMEENIDAQHISAVDASEVEAEVLREQFEAQQKHRTEATDASFSRKTQRKNVLAEINAVKGLLRAQADAAGPSDGGVTQELLRQRVQGLQTTLATFQGASDEDAWSSSEDEEDIKGTAGVETEHRAASKSQHGVGTSKAPAHSHQRAAAHLSGASTKKKKAQETASGKDTAALGGAIQETEREKQVRLGLITPFQNLPGFSRGVVRRTGAKAVSDGDPDVPFSEAARKKLEATATFLVNASKKSEANAPKTKLLDASELTEDDLRAVRKTEYFLPRGDTRFGRGPSGAKAAAAAEKEGTKKWRAALVAARPHVPAGAASGSRRRRSLPDDEVLDLDEVEDLEDPVVAEAPQLQEGSDDDKFDDADSDFYEERLEAVQGGVSALGDSAVRQAVLASSTSQPSSLANSPPSSPRPSHAAAKGTASEGAAAGTAQGADVEKQEVSFDGGLTLPATLYDRLFTYQQVGVQWMWELHMQRTGGIMGDEMGLGKTIQLIAFLGGLHHSGMHRPSLVIAPVTTLRHWQRELRHWYPQFRVIVLHSSARSRNRGARSIDSLVAKARRSKAGVILMGYEGLRRHSDTLLPLDWGYVILDEGHRIRNPDAEITLLCKQVRTSHRVIMSGTPIQNRLSELWSLFDFVFPGKLGTLPVFQAQFGTPIQSGTYANATPMAVTAAYKCAVMLRDMISPYLLRRTKVDVAKQLPKKSEQVLFCSLSPPQRQLYQAYLHSRDVADILEGRRPAMEGITLLRKICNHADLLHRTELQGSDDVEYGALERSSKLQVAMQVLHKWRAAGHKALLFTQTQQMLDILEHHVAAAGMPYLRMDGSVPPPVRFRMIDAFNRHPPAGTPPGSPHEAPVESPRQCGDEAQAGTADLEDDDVIVTTGDGHASRGAGSCAQKDSSAVLEDDAEDDMMGACEQRDPEKGGGAGPSTTASHKRKRQVSTNGTTSQRKRKGSRSKQLLSFDDSDEEAEPAKPSGTSQQMQQSAPSQQGNSDPDEQGSLYDADGVSSEGSESESSEDDFDGLSDSNADKNSRRRARGKGGQTSRKQRPRAKRKKGRKRLAEEASDRAPKMQGRQAQGNANVFVFLLTTRVGGLGVNLTAADRVMLFDPDWNPSTDIQARERSWRLGQKRPVTIYRLLTRGTIEEKVYHRQIYKHALSTRVLSDPRQRRFVSSAGVRDLFTLSDKRAEGNATDTGKLCQRVGGDVVDRSTLPVHHGADASPPASSALEPPSNTSNQTEHTAPVPPGKGSSMQHAAGESLHPEEDDGEGSGKEKVPEGEAKLLAELFAGAEGLHSAIDHGALEDASAPARRDAERRAEQVAQHAADAVLASRAEVQRRAVHIPTWTGKAGNAGAPGPGNPPRFGQKKTSASLVGCASGSAPGQSRLANLTTGGATANGAHTGTGSGGSRAVPSAAEVIAGFRVRQAAEKETDEAAEAGADTGAQQQPRRRGPARGGRSSGGAPAVSPKEVSNAQDVLAQLVAYFSGRRGAEASSEAVVGEFSDAAQSLGGELFRQTLKQAATLDKRKGVWTLRAEFQ